MKIAVIQKLRMDCEGFDLVLAGGVFRSCQPASAQDAARDGPGRGP